MGLEQLAELQGRMDPILKSLGYTQGHASASACRRSRRTRATSSPKATRAAPRSWPISSERLAKIRAVLPRAFNTLVPGHLEVKRMSPEQEPGAPAAYGGAGSIDGKIPGKFWINLRTTDLHSKYSLPDLAAHEAIPGHVWQGEYANKLPLIRTLLAFNAYSEGWALYAEQLVDELGVYDDFPVGRLGYLQSIAFRCCRLVVDSGIHAKRWTRAAGRRFLRPTQRLEPARGRQSKSTAIAAGRARPAATRSATRPSTACATRRRRSSGRSTTCEAFDDAVVLGGNVPMDVLAKNIDDYIARTKAA